MDTTTIGTWVVLATQVVTLVSSIIGVVLGLRNRTAVHEVHLSLNSRMDQLVAASRAEGKLDGIAEGKETTNGSDV